MDLYKQMQSIAETARAASRKMALVSTSKKNEVLSTIADLINKETENIKSANKKDLENARKSGLNEALIDRLTLSPERIESMIRGIRRIIELQDPAGRVLKEVTRPNGLKIKKVSVPIGVICIIYESRPNVTVDSAGLCFKSGNCVILRGGKESISTNVELSRILQDALEKHGLPKECIQLLGTTDRSAIPALLKFKNYIDLVIPRGGEALIRTIVRESEIPVIKHYKGVCHVYVDQDADLDMAENIVINAKTQRPGVCNAMETLLVHKNIAEKFLPKIIKKLEDDYKVEIRGCAQSKKIMPDVKSADEDDWSSEYLDLILSIKIVDNLDGAINHINKYGSMHSDSIVTNNKNSSDRFINEVDSACVFVNSSTRFSDGGEFGMGAEIGISTDKIHARGPMGLEELTSYKYIIEGNGQIRE